MRHQVRVHRQRQRRGAAGVREVAEHRAQLGVRGAAAAQLGGHAGGEQPALAELVVVVGHERVVGVVGRGPGGEAGPQLAGHAGPVRRARSRSVRSGRSHGETSGRASGMHPGLSGVDHRRRARRALPRPKNGLAAPGPRVPTVGGMKGYGQFCPVAMACRDLRRAVDAAHPARAVRGRAPLQRHPAGHAAHLAHAAGPAAARAGGRRRRAEPAAAQRPRARVPADCRPAEELARGDRTGWAGGASGGGPGSSTRRTWTSGCSCGTCAGGSNVEPACPPSASSCASISARWAGALQAGCGPCGSSCERPDVDLCSEGSGLRRRRRGQRRRRRRWSASGPATPTSAQAAALRSGAAGGPTPARPGAARVADAQSLRPCRAAGARRLTVSIEEERNIQCRRANWLTWYIRPTG